MKISLLILILGLLPACKPEPIETFRVQKEKDFVPLLANEQSPSMPSKKPSMNDATMPAMETSVGAESRSGIHWTTPKSWQQKAPSDMRVGSFLVAGENGQSADVSIVPLAGNAGGDLANINRWRGQINLTPIDEAALDQNSRMEIFGPRHMRLVNMVSAEPMIDGKYKKRVVAAIYESAHRTWFFKMIGDDATVTGAIPAFKSFLSTLKFDE